MIWRVTTKTKPMHRLFCGTLHSFRHLCCLVFLSVPLLAGLVTANGVLLPRTSADSAGPAYAPQGNHKPSPNDCLLYATVFTEEGFLLPGADIYVHPVGKKKPVWEATSDRRGEFAVRVPPDGDYEIEVKAKGYVMQSHTVTAQMGERLDMTFHMPHQLAKKQ